MGGFKLAAAASSYCWLSPARTARRAARIVGGGHREGGDGRDRLLQLYLPSEAAIFVDFGSLQKDPSLWVPCCGRPTYKPPRRGRRRRRQRRTRTRRAALARSGGVWRRAVVDADLVRAPAAHGLLTRTLPKGYESIAGYEEVSHALANSAPTHSLPTYSTALFPQRGWPTCESSRVALAKVSTIYCWAPIFDVVGSKKYRRPAPLSPAAMARLVARKRFTSKKGDLPMVIALNTRTILSIFRDMKMVQYEEVDWGDDDAVQLAEVLPLCTSATKLDLKGNKISDRGAKALAAAFAEGAMPKLEGGTLPQLQPDCPQLQPDWRVRGGLSGGGWEGRAAGARETLPRRQRSFLRRQRTRGKRSRPRGTGWMCSSKMCMSDCYKTCRMASLKRLMYTSSPDQWAAARDGAALLSEL